MANERLVTSLEAMADRVLQMWQDEGTTEEKTDEEINAAEARYAQSYAQICTAIAALNAPKPFLQIGPDIINRSDIVRVEILEARAYTGSDKIMWPKRVKMIFRDIDGGTSDSSYSSFKEYPFDSPEAKAILAWLGDQVEVLVPFEEAVEVIDPFTVSAAESMLAEANEVDVSDFPH
jgi:hypothetical protein